MFMLSSPVLDENGKYILSRIQETKLSIEDLELLVSAINENALQDFRTSLYRQEFNDYLQKLGRHQTAYLKVTTDYERNKILFEQQVIAASEFENFKFEYDKAQSELNLFRHAQLTTWQQRLQAYRIELGDYENQLARIDKEKQALRIKAPVNGTVQNLAGFYPGSAVFASQELAQITPDTDLLAEIYVLPNDIGLLREGMDVDMQIGAFNYNQWGLLHGKVKEISTDVVRIDPLPLFEVKCSLDRDYLALKNGYKGKLKKGMTLQARFVITQRSLWQLLYDKVDSWVKPNQFSQVR